MSASTTADDPYICSWCNFKTVYKGNMKRHLISCHSTTDESLRQNKFDIEKLRATSNDRPVYLPTSYIDEEISVMNGKTPRGRRPKISKNGTKEEVDGEHFASGIYYDSGTKSLIVYRICCFPLSSNKIYSQHLKSYMRKEGVLDLEMRIVFL
jgi:hypothetical protein